VSLKDLITGKVQRDLEMIEIGGIYPLTAAEMNRLADFNSEVARGLVHTEAYEKKMAGLQARFNKSATRGPFQRRSA
jgi:hypothetical protein